MTRIKLLHLLLGCAFLIAPQTLMSADPVPEVDIRSEDGKVLLPADKIHSYDWTTHTLTLASGAREALAKQLFESKKLVGGVPFGIAVGGKVLYTGTFTTILSSKSFSTPIILVDRAAIEEKRGKDQLQIQLGYPTVQFFKGEDPRADKQLREALHLARKLTEVELSHSEWLAQVMKEIATIEPGMTRKDLLKVFEEEGGLSTRTQRRYVYRGSRYIKVDVTFEAVGKPEAQRAESPKDKIVKISKPFLEWSILD